MSYARLVDFTDRGKRLQEFLDSDAVVEITDEEFILLESMHKCVEAYCVVLKQRIDEEAKIIKLGDKSHGYSTKE